MKNKENISQTVLFKNRPKIIGNYSIVGPKEGEGNFKDYYDYILKDDFYGEKTYEKAERKMIEKAVNEVIKKTKLTIKDIGALLSGDLLNQIISSSYAARSIDVPYLGVFGACSTMAETLALGACLIDGKFFKNVICSTSSHFSTAERQFRFPLELGNQRPPTSQWTCTGAGASLLSLNGNGPVISKATFGKVVDFDIHDANNLGAAMAPSAMDTLIAHFNDTNTNPNDYDLIVTGDLGKLGSEILIDLMEDKGYKLGVNYCDCGQMIYTRNQNVLMGGSGCGCSAVVLNSFIIDKLNKGVYNKVLFLATGALLSTISTQQGDSIPGVTHAIVLEGDKNEYN